MHDKSNLIDSIKVNNIEITDAKQIADKFGKFFSSIGYNTSIKGVYSTKGINDYLNKIPINNPSAYLTPCTVTEITTLIENLPNKNSGYDNITNIILKKLGTCLTIPLSDIFNLSLSSGVFPTLMKHADVIPLFKGGNKQIMSNYHPISLLPAISKLLEKIMYKRTYDFLMKYDLLYKSQYGFRKKHSCEHAVTELVGEICKGLENNKHTISIFIDLSKAFDTIDHKILLSKMERYGLLGTVLKWFESYLSKCTMRTKCLTSATRGFHYSESYDIGISTPQGGCLGPLLFLIFCNDIYLNLELCKGILFADDTTIYNSHNNIEYLKWTIVHDLEILTDWFKVNHLSMNSNKSTGMFFTNKKEESIEHLRFSGTCIKFMNETKFLGIWIDHRLSWKEHRI